MLLVPSVSSASATEKIQRPEKVTFPTVCSLQLSLPKMYNLAKATRSRLIPSLARHNVSTTMKTSFSK